MLSSGGQGLQKDILQEERLSAVGLSPDLLRVLDETKAGVKEEIDKAMQKIEKENDEKLTSDFYKRLTKELLVGNIILDIELRNKIEQCGIENVYNEESSMGETIPMIIIKRGSSRLLEDIMKLKPDLTKKDYRKRDIVQFTLEEAPDRILEDVLRILLSNGIDPNHKIGDDPLVKYIYESKNERYLASIIVEEFSPDLNAKGKNGMRILNIAISDQDIYFVKQLLDKGADPNLKTRKGNDAYDYTCTLLLNEENDSKKEQYKKIIECIWSHPSYRQRLMSKIYLKLFGKHD